MDMETIAVYQEEPIKTYGFETSLGLAMFAVKVPGPKVGEFSRAMERLDEPGVRFNLLISAAADEGTLFYSENQGGDGEKRIPFSAHGNHVDRRRGDGR